MDSLLIVVTIILIVDFVNLYFNIKKFLGK